MTQYILGFPFNVHETAAELFDEARDLINLHGVDTYSEAFGQLSKEKYKEDMNPDNPNFREEQKIIHN